MYCDEKYFFLSCWVLRTLTYSIQINALSLHKVKWQSWNLTLSLFNFKACIIIANHADLWFVGSLETSSSEARTLDLGLWLISKLIGLREGTMIIPPAPVRSRNWFGKVTPQAETSVDVVLGCWERQREEKMRGGWELVILPLKIKSCYLQNDNEHSFNFFSNFHPNLYWWYMNRQGTRKSQAS